MRKFKVVFEVEVEIELDDKIFEEVDDSFREHIYNLTSDDDIVEHITTNLISGASLSNLDGWANLSDSEAIITYEDWTITGVEEE